MTVDFLIRTFGIGLVGGMMAVVIEWLRRRKQLSNEDARKALHTLHAVAVVVWANGLQTYAPVIVAELVFAAVVIAVRYRGHLAGLRDVGRKTYGEILFPVGVIAICLLQPRHAVFTVSLLQLGVSDALAAVVGVRVKSYTYKVAGYTKSLAGSSAFFVSSIIIFSVYAAMHSSMDVALAMLIVVTSIIVTVVENLSPYGLDNLTIPLVTYALLTVGIFN